MDLLSFDIGLAVGIAISLASFLIGLKISERLERKRR